MCTFNKFGYIFIYFLSTSFNTASSAAPQIGTVCVGGCWLELRTVATFSLAVRHPTLYSHRLHAGLIQCSARSHILILMLIFCLMIIFEIVRNSCIYVQDESHEEKRQVVVSSENGIQTLSFLSVFTIKLREPMTCKTATLLLYVCFSPVIQVLRAGLSPYL